LKEEKKTQNQQLRVYILQLIFISTNSDFFSRSCKFYLFIKSNSKKKNLNHKIKSRNYLFNGLFHGGNKLPNEYYLVETIGTAPKQNKNKTSSFFKDIKLKFGKQINNNNTNSIHKKNNRLN